MTQMLYVCKCCCVKKERKRTCQFSKCVRARIFKSVCTVQICQYIISYLMFLRIENDLKNVCIYFVPLPPPCEMT